MQAALPVKRIAYYALCLWILVRQTVLDLLDRAKHGLHSRFPSLFNSLRRWLPARGVSPPPPSVLGLIVTEYAAESHLQALTRILTWAHLQGFRSVLLYDPSGTLKEERDVLSRQPQLASLPGSLKIQAGWKGPPLAGPTPAADDLVEHETRVVLLAAEDAQWPLDAAAGGGPKDDPAPPADARTSRLEQALAAPERLRRRLAGVAGPAAGLDPDFLVVFGPVLTLGGFPAWAARSSEIYFGGPLCQASGSKLQSILRRHSRTKQRHGR